MYRRTVPRSPLTVGQAATTLGVSSGRVRQLAQRGQLDAVFDGPGVQVSAASVEERALRAPGRGRPWSPATVWAAAWLLDDREPGWLNDRTLRRLRLRVAASGLDVLLARLEPLALASRWAAAATDLEAVRAEAGMAWSRDAAGTLTVCLPKARAEALPRRYGLHPGDDLVLVATTGYRASADRYVPSLLL